MEAPMSSSLGAMGPLLKKLDSLLALEYRLPKPLKDGIELLKEDLEEISAALVEQSMVDSPNHKAKYWMDEVREVSYDTEDCIDNMMRRHTDADAKIRSVHRNRVGRVKITRFSKTPKPCTRIAKIAELRALVREAIERHERYQLDDCASGSSRVFTGHGRVPAVYGGSANYPVGIHDSKMKLIKWLTNEAERQTKMVSIAGSAGVGKTTLAKELYHELGGQFECRAFVRASRKPDMRRLLVGILYQVQRRQRPCDACTVQNLIDDLREHLQDKRVAKLASQHAVVCFGTSNCCLCHSVKMLFFNLGVKLKVYELDKDPMGKVIEMALARMVGRNPPVPSVFIGGKLVGSINKIMSLHLGGELVPLLCEAGALWL